MNTVKTQEEWRRLADMSKEKGVPAGWVYVGNGVTGDHGLNFGPVLSFKNLVGEWLLSGVGIGKITGDEYICPVEDWEEKTGLKFMKTFAEVKAARDAAQKEYDAEVNKLDALLVEAKKLVGKKIEYACYVGGIRLQKEIVERVSLVTDNSVGFLPGSHALDFFLKNGYVILLHLKSGGHLPYAPEFIVNVSSGIAVNGYEGEDKGDYWKFGCAEINKEVLKRAKQLIDMSHLTPVGNRKIESIKIGEGVFTLEILKEMFPDGAI
jgi:hypothetical protein